MVSAAVVNSPVVNLTDEQKEQISKMLARDKQVAGTHYKDMGVEPWDVVDTWPLEQRIGAYRHGALKYLMRMGSKDEQLQEIKKCGHYIEKLIEVLESEDKNLTVDIEQERMNVFNESAGLAEAAAIFNGSK